MNANICERSTIVGPHNEHGSMPSIVIQPLQERRAVQFAAPIQIIDKPNHKIVDFIPANSLWNPCVKGWTTRFKN